MRPFIPTRRAGAGWQFRVPRVAWAVICLFLLNSTGPAEAQFIYLDSNGDGVSTPADILNGLGRPTTVGVWLDSVHRRDGSALHCEEGGDTLRLMAYEFVLHAAGGTVSYASYSNRLKGANPPSDAVSSDSDFYSGFISVTPSRSGLLQLGTLTITATSGEPCVDLAASSALAPAASTSFRQQCGGWSGDRIYTLGLDWWDTAGCAPPGGNGGAPAAVVPQQVDVPRGQFVEITGTFSAIDPASPLVLTASGFPAGLRPVVGQRVSASTQMRLYGIIDDTIAQGSSYDVEWTASDGATTRTARTRLHVVGREPDSTDVEARVVQLVTARYQHGMDFSKARSLGTPALPILARMLRDEAHRRSWSHIIGAIGAIGDTACFDTLRAFIWDRFRGPVGEGTFMAIRIAQRAFSTIATVSPRALDYLLATSAAAAWKAAPWRVEGYSNDAAAALMAKESLIALCWTDSERAAEAIRDVSTPTDSTALYSRYERAFAQGLRDVARRVRTSGLNASWTWDREASTAR